MKITKIWFDWWQGRLKVLWGLRRQLQVKSILIF